MTSVAETVRGLAKRAIRRGAATVGPHRWRTRKPRLWVLMYHRVLPSSDARVNTEEPGMIVTPETFQRHLDWLQMDFDVVSLGEWVQRMTRREPVPRRAAAITFDDGWRDNHEFALPILRRAGVPATVFAVSHMIGTEAVFWPNQLIRMLRKNGLDATARHLSLEWLRNIVPDAHDRPLTPDEISRVIEACKSLSDDELRSRLDRAAESLALPPISPPPLMDWAQLREMADSGLIEVGSHTCRHTRLNDATPTGITAQEILESKSRLERSLARPIRLFCYPNGDVSALALALVQEHYDAAVTTRSGINGAATPLHALRRVSIHEGVAREPHEFFARLSTWV
jgi:peptidoglycan/xylan/chitin deacetylase (PgdA/CDA1 family)